MWATLFPVLIGALIGAGGPIATQIIRHRMEDGRTRRALAGAFAGEVAAICAIARRRDYLSGLEQYLAHVRETKQPTWMCLHITQNYFRVYESNAGALGLLPTDAAEHVAIFYTQVKSLLEDVLPSAPAPSTAENAERRLSDQIALLSDTLKLGDDLVARLRRGCS